MDKNQRLNLQCLDLLLNSSSNTLNLMNNRRTLKIFNSGKLCNKRSLMKLEGVFIVLFLCSIIMANIQHSMVNLGEKVGQISAPRFPSGPLHFVQRSLQCVPQLLSLDQRSLAIISQLLDLLERSLRTTQRSLGVFLFSAQLLRCGSLPLQRSLAVLQWTAGLLEFSRFPTSAFTIFLSSILHISHKIRKNTKIDKICK